MGSRIVFLRGDALVYIESVFKGGGQGMKTVNPILGAAFSLAEFEVQVGCSPRGNRGGNRWLREV